uniref:Uncharacterized protein n=1 Tax=Tetraselmis chuii TaxID=63592 RepID=A0A7S1X0A2_9CHLO|mmetsp:Transcript_18785/g.33542  ORF Transcript_18785/g.33542 Transcript_18785/m.33542 type:complete len:227 (+) Transcript_18785:214-894(+)|eukprot:CAMPEP_0177765696 /NCGR_PEP_ID=MMETSP0491_2-20121128/8127_1 /TAXON_ID=63592 /ORGANISM="Tetraselmis chuii, Strain PLY429" /LENGTH=226 /DNA_ID=CAMNT_0019282057 /DNA_START=203 /DNA_END=883 /DNA_ORIENTATION=-
MTTRSAAPDSVGTPPTPQDEQTDVREEDQPSPKSTLPEERVHTERSAAESQEATAEEEAELDEESMQLLQDMKAQEAELEAILSRHSDDAADLLRIRDAMARELEELKEEAWRLEAVQDLELMRGRLEGMLHAGDAEDSSGAEQPSAEANAELEAPAAKESVGASMQTLLQMEEDVLDEELAALRMQLQDIKMQAADMDNRRKALVEELSAIEMPEKWDSTPNAAE